jgi:hypothetical protein
MNLSSFTSSDELERERYNRRMSVLYFLLLLLLLLLESSSPMRIIVEINTTFFFKRKSIIRTSIVEFMEGFEGKLVIKNQFEGQSLAVFTSGGDAQGKISRSSHTQSQQTATEAKIVD